MAAKKTAKTSSSKADFVRAHADLSPKEIVEKGKAEGVKLNASYVYNVRNYEKSKTQKKVTKRAAHRATARKAPSVTRSIATNTSAEDLLRAVAAELGLGRAIELLQGERARVHAVMRG